MEEKKLTGWGGIFAERLQKLMKDAKVTQQGLAEAVGTTRQAISQYADGSVQPNIEKLKKIAIFFHVSADYLLGIQKDRSPDVNVKALALELGLSENTITHLEDLNYGEIDIETISDEDRLSAYISDEFIELYNYVLEDYNCYDFFLGIIRFCNVSFQIYKGEKLKNVLGKVTQSPFKSEEVREMFHDLVLTPEGEITYTVTPEEAKAAILNNAADEFKKFVEKYASHKISKIEELHSKFSSDNKPKNKDKK